MDAGSLRQQADDQDDIALLLMSGDAEALGQLLRDHGEKVFVYLKNKFRDTALAEEDLEEAMSTALLKVHRHIDRYNDKRGKIATWWCGIAIKEAQSILRNHNRKMNGACLLGADDCDIETIPESVPAEDTPSPMSDSLKKELCSMVEELPPMQKAIIRSDLAAGEEISARTLADKIGASSASSVIVSRHKAKEALREKAKKRGLIS